MFKGTVTRARHAGPSTSRSTKVCRDQQINVVTCRMAAVLKAASVRQLAGRSISALVDSAQSRCRAVADPRVRLFATEPIAYSKLAVGAILRILSAHTRVKAHCEASRMQFEVGVQPGAPADGSASPNPRAAESTIRCPVTTLCLARKKHAHSFVQRWFESRDTC